MMDEIIKWSGVYKTFEENRVLQNLSLGVRPGETITIIGGSGSGKSVMVRLLLGLMEMDKGHIYFNGRDVGSMEENELIDMRRKVGMLFQGGALFDSLTVEENVAYPLREHFEHSEDKIHEIVAHKLYLIGLDGTQSVMPADLSGGMKKRVALARAIATEPDVIIYDEPTTGLDPANTMRINRLIKDLQKKLQVTSIVVTHDMESAFFVSDRIAMLYNGKIEFVGTPAEAKRSKSTVVQNFIHGRIGDDEEISMKIDWEEANA